MPLAERVGFADHTRFVDLSASATGVLLYGAGNMVMRRAVWLKRDGSLLETVGEPGWMRAVRLSPDGRRAVIEQGIERALWMLNFDLHVSTRLTFEQELSGWPAWSPNGAQVAYTAQRSGGRLRLYRRDSGGGVPEKPLSASGFDLYMYDWSRDGRYAAYCEMNPQTKIDLWILPMSADAKTYPLLHTAFNEDSPQFSPMSAGWPTFRTKPAGTRCISPASRCHGQMADLHPGRLGSSLEWRWEGAFLPGYRRPTHVRTDHDGWAAVAMVGPAPAVPHARARRLI